MLSPTPNPPPDVQQRRTRAVRLTVAASAGAKIFSVVCTLAQVPVVLNYIGTEGYGLWITLVSVTVLLNFVDFGLGIGMQQAMAAAYGRDDNDGIRRAFFTGVAALGALAGLVLVAGIPIAWFGDWADTLKITDAGLRAQSNVVIAITVAACALTLPLNAGPRLAAAVQRGWIQAGWIAGGSATSLLVAFWAAHAHWSFPAFITVTALMPVAQGIGLIVHLALRLRWPASGVRLLDSAETRDLYRASAWVALPQFGMALLQAAPPLAISLVDGPAAVTGFNLLMRLFSPVMHGQTLMLAPLWPAYTEAQVRNDHRWIKRAFGSSLLGAAAFAACLIAITWQADTLVGWWVHQPGAAPAGIVAWGICAWAVVQVFGQPLFNLLIGLGRMKPLAWWGTVGASAAAVGLFCANESTAHVLIGGTLGLALVWLPGLAWASAQSLRQPS